MSYIHYPLNYIPDSTDSNDFKFDKKLFKGLTKHKRSKILGTLPKKIDHTPNMTPIKDQGELGSCVAFATVALKEWQEKQEYMKRVRKDTNVFDTNVFNDLSEQWVYHKTKDVDNINGEGTMIRYALKVLRNVGVPIEESWMYNPHHRGKPQEHTDDIAKFTKIGNYYKINSLNQLKLALLHTPVPMGVLVFKTFYQAARLNGVVAMPNSRDNQEGGHAICAVGYNDETKMIKFKNSWSVAWGEDGYGYIPYEYFKKYCMAAWAVDNVQVPISYLEQIKEYLV